MTSGESRVGIRKATTQDLDAIKGLADAHRQELGFVRRPALADAIKREEVMVAESGPQLIGFIEYHHRRDGQTTLYHLAVDVNHRRRGVGRLMLRALRRDARARGKRAVCIKCPLDLVANGFYERVGCALERTQEGRGRPLAVWRLTV